MNLNILQDIVENGRAWYPAIHGVERVRRDLLTEQQQQFHNWNFPHIQAHWGTTWGPCRAHLRIILLRWYLSMCYAPVPHGLPLGASPLEHVLNELLLPPRHCGRGVASHCSPGCMKRWSQKMWHAAQAPLPSQHRAPWSLRSCVQKYFPESGNKMVAS